MARTQADLATAVLKELRIIAADETPSAEDQATVLAKYADMFEEMKDRDVAFWPVASIPSAVFGALTKVIAAECAASFGVAFDPQDAYRRLIVLATRESTPIPTPAEYF